jgi:hypothetical protein
MTKIDVMAWHAWEITFISLICLTAGELRAVNGRPDAGYCGVAEQPRLPQPGQAHLHPHPRHARPHPPPIQVHPHHSSSSAGPFRPHASASPDLGLYLGTPRPQQVYHDCTFVCL